jgi:hypothetical protein
MAQTPQDFWGGVWGQQPQQQQWGGWNANNVFSSWDLNPLSQQTGVARDDLANQRDAFLQPIEANYRQAMAGQGQQVDATSQNLFSDPNFQAFAQKGALPANASPAQQWNATPSPAPQGPTGGTGGTLMQLLMQRAGQGQVTASDPNVRAQADAYNANEQRASRNYLADVAEKAGPQANLAGEQRMAAERLGQRTGGFEAELIGREQAARRDEIQQALQMWGGLLSNDQRMALERELATMSNQSHAADRTQANEQFLRELALRESDQNNAWDYRWAGLGV